MITRKRMLLLAVIATLSCGVWSWQRAKPRAAAVPTAADRVHPVENPASRKETEERDGKVRVVSAAATRREAFVAVRALYRKEQLTRELALEQQRYTGSYWEPTLSGRELTALQQAREQLIQRLADEANQVLRDLFPGEAGEAIALTPFFDAGRAGPRLDFLAPELRERFEAALLAESDGAPANGEQLGRVAEQLLSRETLELYRKWNEPAVAALRERLVGFHATEAEFGEIRRSVADPEDGALESRLGSARFAEFLRLEEPATQTAAQDLRRLGLPVEGAAWLADTRARASASIQEVWKNGAWPLEVKQSRVQELERAFGDAIAARFSLPRSTVDELIPES